MENNIDKIIKLFTLMVNETKADILPLLKKEAWDELSEIRRNFGIITEAYNEFGKFLVVAKEMTMGKDGILDKADEEKLISGVAEIVNRAVDIPMVFEFIEARIFNFLLYSGYSLAKNKFKSSPQLQGVYNAFAKNLAKR